MKVINMTLWLCATLLLSGCASNNGLWQQASNQDLTASDEAIKERSQLEVRQMQTREFGSSDTKMIMKAMLNVLQDDGFIVKNAVPELGLLSATKEMDTENGAEAVLSTLLVGRHARWEKNAIIEATANVTEFGDKTRVRITFQQKRFDNYGQVKDLNTIEDPLFYQGFFSKVDKGVFIEDQGV